MSVLCIEGSVISFWCCICAIDLLALEVYRYWSELDWFWLLKILLTESIHFV